MKLSFKNPLIIVLALLALTFNSLGLSSAQAAPARQPQTQSMLRQFTSSGHVLGFTSKGVYAATSSHALQVSFLRANLVTPQSASPGSADGKVIALTSVSYPDLWDGITLSYSAGGIFTTTYTLAPGADVRNIQLLYNAQPTLNPDGSLNIAFETGSLSESAPIAWQEINGNRVAVDVSFQVEEQILSFALGSYNPAYPLTIDPTLTWNTFLGGSGNSWGEWGYAMAVDGSGNVYVTGYGGNTWGTPVRAYSGGVDAFVAKLDSSGSLIWNTFLGGSVNDWGYSIAVDGNGKVYVAGTSIASWGTPVRAYSGDADAFAAQLNSSSGNLIWNTFLGGTGGDASNSIVVDGSGNVYMMGFSNATWGTPVQAYSVQAYSGNNDAFAAQLNSLGNLIWSTFLGGSGDDVGNSIAVDGSGKVYVAGASTTTWGTPVRAFSNKREAFVARLDSSGNLIWNTFLGGNDDDAGNSIAVDGSGNAYVTGYSLLYTWGSPVRAFYPGFEETFVARLDSSGNLIWNTFLGGSGNDAGNSIVVDGSNRVYVVGGSDATWGTPAQAYSANNDAFVAKLNSFSGSLTWNTFLGGNGDDWGSSIAVDGSGKVYAAGASSASWGTPVRAYSAGYDAYDAFVSLIASTSFSDVSANNPYWQDIEILYANGYTGGCSTTPLLFCPDTVMNRAQSSVFMMRGNFGSGYVPVTPTHFFKDNWANALWAEGWAESMFLENLTGGCSASSLLFCPYDQLTNVQVAVFGVRLRHGLSYTPPAATGTVFADMTDVSFWGTAWAEQAYADGLLPACGTGAGGKPLFCPNSLVSRGFGASIIVKAKNLTMP